MGKVRRFAWMVAWDGMDDLMKMNTCMIGR